MILVFWMLSFKPTFSLSSFIFIKRLFSSSSLSAIRVVSSAYLRPIRGLKIHWVWTHPLYQKKFQIQANKGLKETDFFLICIMQWRRSFKTWLNKKPNVKLLEKNQILHHYWKFYACTVSNVQLFAIPWTVAHQVPLSMGFFMEEYWRGLPFPSLGDLPDPESNPMSPASSALAGRFFTTEPQSFETWLNNRNQMLNYREIKYYFIIKNSINKARILH